MADFRFPANFFLGKLYRLKILERNRTPASNSGSKLGERLNAKGQSNFHGGLISLSVEPLARTNRRTAPTLHRLPSIRCSAFDGQCFPVLAFSLRFPPSMFSLLQIGYGLMLGLRTNQVNDSVDQFP